MSRICTKKNAETHTDSYLGTKIWVVWQEQYVNETSLKYLGEKKKRSENIYSCTFEALWS